jgi:threonine dehydrogenase-like Zn-dependent dehydrogenase
MRAVLMQRGKLWVDTIDDPTPGSGEVLVKSRACGICGSDLHAALHTEDFVATSRESGGAFKLTTFDPVVLGHEFCAEIVDFGPDTERKLNPGQLVCSVPMLLRTEPLAIGNDEKIPGGFAEYMVLSEPMMRAVPDGTPTTAAALTEPMAVGLHAVNRARLGGREAVLVIGTGPVGLAVLTALKATHKGPIIASDLSSGRRRFAEHQGAHAALDPSVDNPFAHQDIARAGELVIFECVGVPGMLDRVFLDAPQNARIIVVGVCLQTDKIRPLIAINKELALQFVLGYSMDEFDTSLRAIADGRFDVASMVTSEVALDDVGLAFRSLADPEGDAKIVVNPWLESRPHGRQSPG